MKRAPITIDFVLSFYKKQLARMVRNGLSRDEANERYRLMRDFAGDIFKQADEEQKERLLRAVFGEDTPKKLDKFACVECGGTGLVAGVSKLGQHAIETKCLVPCACARGDSKREYFKNGGTTRQRRRRDGEEY